MSGSVVLLFDPARVDDLRAELQRGSFRFEDRPNALFLAKREGVTVTAYASGKLLLTGAQAEEYAGVLAGKALAKPQAPGPRPPASGPVVEGPHAGSDESGKGDFFGPLAVACVFVPDAATERTLREAGIRDSKTIPNAEIGPLASLVRARCPHATVVLDPPAYNDLYERMRNLNDLLAWAHATAIEDLLSKVGVVPVVVDQFAQGVLARHLKPLGRSARVVEVVRGEADVAVAAASVLARAEFMAGIARLEARHGVKLPLGAGAPTLAAAKRIKEERGPELLREVAKVHFAMRGL